MSKSSITVFFPVFNEEQNIGPTVEKAVFYTDGDGQFDFSEVTKFLDIADDNDVIVGFRIKRQDPFYRLIFAKLWAFSVFLFFGFVLKDLDCGFKMIKRYVIKDIMPLQSSRGAGILASQQVRVLG